MPPEDNAGAPAPAPSPSPSPSPAPAPAPGPAPAPSPSPSPSPAPGPAPAPEPAPAPGPAPAPAPAEGDWPADWRQRLSADDAKALAQLERFGSPKDVFHSYRELQKQLSSGAYRKVLPKDAKPEDVTEWRKANGIPETPDKYDLTLEDGTVIGDADKPMVMKFVERMHGENATPTQVKAALASYFDIQKEVIARRDETDAANKIAVEEELRAEYGGEYRANVNIVKAMLQSAPGEIADDFLTARMANGKRVVDDPRMVRFLVNQARALHPTATIVPSGGDQSKAITDEIAQIESTMRLPDGSRNPAYYNNAEVQARYARLLEARSRQSGRG